MDLNEMIYISIVDLNIKILIKAQLSPLYVPSLLVVAASLVGLVRTCGGLRCPGLVERRGGED